MPAFHKPGKRIRSYEIVRELNRGAFANAYEAKNSRGKVFLKQYKSPTRLVDWYPAFVDHQKELKRRIESTSALKTKCYRFDEFFDDPSGFHQIFEFVEGGQDLAALLKERGSVGNDRLLLFTKTMMFGIKYLHREKIVHCDLKPENIILIPDADRPGELILRIIDLDWAIFSDRKAPWHGVQGYTQTPGYGSPEHNRGEVPQPASDVFTCGIMLGEVLGEGHPFAAADDYVAASLAGRFKPIKLTVPFPSDVDTTFVEVILNACLDPNPARRPTAEQICDALMGKSFVWAGYLPPRPPEPVRAVAPARVASPAPAPTSLRKKIAIEFEGKVLSNVSVDAEFGKQHFKAVHADAQFLSNPQFKLKKSGNQWLVEHCTSATNETLIDGKKLTGSQIVQNGMHLSVGNSTKGIEKFPLVLKLVD